MHPLVQTEYPEPGAVFQDGNAPIHTRLVRERFSEHEIHVEYLPWPSQSLDLNIVEPLWIASGRIFFSPPASHS